MLINVEDPDIYDQLAQLNKLLGGFSYTTKREEVRVGPVGITAEEKKTFRIPPAVGGLLVAGGIVLLIASGRQR